MHAQRWSRLVFACAAALGAAGQGCIYARMISYNVPTLDAPSYFDSRVVAPSEAPLPFHRRVRETRFALTDAQQKEYRSFDDFLEAQETRAFVVVQNETIVYERYFGDVTATTILPCFSMSKTFAALLVLRAVQSGLLASLGDPVTAYVPPLLDERRYDQVTLEHLLRMTSGIDFNEESLAGVMFYYTTNLRGLMYEYDVVRTPGEHYTYGSVNIQLLWDAIHRSLEGETVTHYFQEQVWGPLGAEQAASWSLDSAASGVEKFASGFNARARDYARIGVLFSNGGSLSGRQILAKKWVQRSLWPDPIAGSVQNEDGRVYRTRYQWFLTRNGRGYFAKGYKGQYVFVVPAKRAVFVRFGEGYGDIDWTTLFLRLADEL